MTARSFKPLEERISRLVRSLARLQLSDTALMGGSAQPRRLLGLLRRTDMVHAYDVALTRRAAVRHRAQQVRLGAFGGVDVEEIVVEAGAQCAGKRLKAVAWPQDCLIVTLRGGREVLLPHGDTLLQPGDVLVVVVEGDARQAARELCRKTS